jgi:uncharacterized membrane protein
MIIYFTIYSFLGYLMESTYVSILQRKWISSGLLKGPFIPLYGIGACILMISSPYIHQPFLSFLLGGSLMTLLEYITSLFIERVFHKKCWDYSKHHFQYQGRICLFYFITWCLLSYIFLYYIHPFAQKHIIINEFIFLICMIYIIWMIKDFIQLFNHSQNQHILKEKEPIHE